MLDSETKRRIDSCRDTLVGKVPDPKSQVEQITIALIYKFMDDMDSEAEELGGARSFFAGDFDKYRWTKLMNPNMGGINVLAQYSEAIQRMNDNPGIPALFREIFKNAYLPYRDPETLRSFLKEINGFTYDHSERLGDAFEYLLSVLGSQGDAGQFRTPRHIIDFMVAIIDPQKDESIIDPACGTAGFLISSYKHILKQNSKNYQQENNREAYDQKGVPIETVTLESPLHYKAELLTVDDRKRLAANITGYDISPDMVRLSLVNLYLHGFTDPHIFEYDTLTSEERWNDCADIILANPPFMTPKGGIKPHKRFSVQATRSEVLFVNYIAEHLTPTGRAAIVVPDGIVSQRGRAYKQLRKQLLDQYLVAVISLPAGVFNPYSGVKTSIIVLDKRLSKKTKSILFAEIENDGFNLGAQRRAIDKNDLPAAIRNIKAWLDSLNSDAPFELDHGSNLWLVEKTRISNNGDLVLNRDLYQSGPKLETSFPLRPIGELIDTLTPPGKLQTPQYQDKGRFPIIDQSQQEVAGWTDNESLVISHSNPLVIFGDHTCAVKLVKGDFAQGADGIKIIETDESLLPSFLYYFLKVYPLHPDGYKRHFSDLKRKEIPLPSIPIQNEIVTEIERYQKRIDELKHEILGEEIKINGTMSRVWGRPPER